MQSCREVLKQGGGCVCVWPASLGGDSGSGRSTAWAGGRGRREGSGSFGISAGAKAEVKTAGGLNLKVRLRNLGRGQEEEDGKAVGGNPEGIWEPWSGLSWLHSWVEAL